MKKILNFKFQILNSSRGYTLIELITATSIIVIVSGLIAGVLYSALRGGNKTSITNAVSQNGNYALSVISNTILSASSVTGVGGNDVNDCTSSPQGTSLTLQQPNGLKIQFACTNDSIASTSAGFTTYLVDNSTVKVDDATCSFSCTQPNNDPYSLPIINISFTVLQKNSDIASEGKASALFKTAVTMRSYNPQ